MVEIRYPYSGSWGEVERTTVAALTSTPGSRRIAQRREPRLRGAAVFRLGPPHGRTVRVVLYEYQMLEVSAFVAHTFC